MAKPKDESSDVLELSKFRFTPERLRQACQRVQEVGGRYRWRDEACPHLTVRVGFRGGVFYRWGRDPKTGRVVSERIGEVLGPNSVALEAARNRCNELRFDPEARAAVSKRRRSGHSPAISEIWDQYIEAISTGRFSMSRKRRPLRASTIQAYKENFKANLEAHKDKNLHWLAKNLPRMFEEIGTVGRTGAEKPKPSPAQANKLLQVCKNLFEFARREGRWSEPNPAIDPVTGETYVRFVLPKREVRLTPAQAKRLYAAMKAKGQFWCDFFAVAALTGRRLSNVRELEWENIDFDTRVIIDAPEDMKNNEPNICPLSDTVLEILKRRRAEAEEDAVYVFPGRKTGMPIINPDHAWDEIRVAARLKHVRIHDLRHNAGSWASGAGHSQATIGKFLSQKSVQSTHRYTHANVEDAMKASRSVEEMWLKATDSTTG
jgi:integrase